MHISDFLIVLQSVLAYISNCFGYHVLMMPEAFFSGDQVELEDIVTAAET